VHPNDALLALGEVAAAFAGFSGVVAALGVKSLASMPALHRFRFANLLMISVGAALFAFLPVVLDQFSVDPGTVWASSSLFLALFAGSLLVTRWRAGLRLGPLTSGPLNLWMALCWIVSLSAVLLLQVANLAEWPWSRAGAPYVAGVFGLLFLSGLQFISLALPRHASDPRGEPEG
jgi:hypothetical protein